MPEITQLESPRSAPRESDGRSVLSGKPWDLGRGEREGGALAGRVELLGDPRQNAGEKWSPSSPLPFDPQGGDFPAARSALMRVLPNP